ncbi:ribosomal protein S10p/S20e [Plectosphaerella cucumerina]|uniref:Small ribosomal subunit protein uS10m n=1 Tax=Plectosphaerella cucumerina TaxID=40658 RepID=A0A8K0T634_9PEZI|nr:ribosomal protein S10p/S20e [Plectosphaerella cucumerina]
MRASTLLRPATRLLSPCTQAPRVSCRFLTTTTEAVKDSAAPAPATEANQPIPENDSTKNVRFPRSVQALYLKPLRREAEYGIPSCDLQLRSFSVRNLEFFSDFALRAAYYLNLPAFGPVPLPRITERWTVPRSNFIFKKSQENFERVTLRRLIQIRDGNPETVQLWLAFLQKHAYYGIGMKANVWEFSSLGVGKDMAELDGDLSQAIESKWDHFAQHKTLGTVQKVEELLTSRKFRSIQQEEDVAAQWKDIRARSQAS